MSEIQIGPHWYRCMRMPTRIQFHVVKRLMPVLQGLAPVIGLSQQRLMSDGEGNLVPGDVNVFEALAALTNTIGMMSDADADYVLDAALSAVQWRQNDRWLPLRVQGGGFLNGDADRLDVQMRLLWEVLVESLGNFSLETLVPSIQTNGLDQMAMAHQ